MLITLVFIAGGAYLFTLFKTSYSKKEILIFAVGIRALFLFSTPNLSDDYYRFAWDGQMIVEGENPYLVLPEEQIKSVDDGYLNELYEGMNSKKYYTVYPPFNQAIFAVSAFLGQESLPMTIFWMKFFLFLSEIAMLLLIFKLLKLLKMVEHLAVIYAFNPLVIVELVGNIHFEGMMLMFLLLSIFFLMKHKLLLAGVAMALAINTKLIPLMLLPLFISYLGFKRSISYYIIIGGSILLMFVPFVSKELIANLGSSIDLYFQNFEFNASFYYLVRWVGFQLTGYNVIKIVGYILPLIALGTIARQSFKGEKENAIHLFQRMSNVLFVYYLVASIVHPWYVINLIVLSVFTNKRYLLVWSITVFLSYFAYSNYIADNGLSKHTSSWYFAFVAIEYIVVGIVFYFESGVVSKSKSTVSK